ncbi:MAG: PTS sugar transporter subunit IIA [Thermodesulfobacteriota bacterium]
MKRDLLTHHRADSFLRMIRRAQRGRLKIYLGYGAGVGKTYQMLLEGHRLKAEGIDVVIGLLETHGRIDIEKLAEGMEVVPRRREEYRGVTLEEMDVDAVLARKPELALIDELAHTNAPGSSNPKRYQDVQEILAAGIHVITTLNVQHLESLYDTVEKEVKVKVRERLPDTVVTEADEIVNVDLSPEDLRKRLQEGKIYPRQRVRTALDHFFAETNLETLRELTLRELAAQIDLRRRERVEDDEVTFPDQVMVCLSSRGPNSEMLLRYGSRLAGRLNRNWYAVYVQTLSEAPTVIDSHTQHILSGTLTLAKQLGALVFTYKGEDVAATILRFAKEYRVGHIVIGSPGPVSFRNRLLRKKNLVQRLIEEARGMTITVLDTRRSEADTSTELTESETPAVVSEARSSYTPAAAPTLSSFLTRGGILFWDQPLPKEAALKELLGAGLRGTTRDERMVLVDLMRRENVSSTFLNEGVAFPHARLSGLPIPMIALGIARHGISDISTEQPIRLIFLLLTPEEHPEAQVRLLRLAARAAQDRILVDNLSVAADAEAALDSLRRWESEHRLSSRS